MRNSQQCNSSIIEDDDNFVPLENNYGKTHNDGLDFIFNSLNIHTSDANTRLRATPEDLLQQAVLATHEFVHLEAGEAAYLQAQKEITKEKYLNTTIEQLEKNGSPNTLYNGFSYLLCE